MSFKAEIYRVLVASPSDMAEERQAATEAINDWNAEHAVAEEVVLLPIKWETHAFPQSGVRPQEAINRQLVDECQIMIGMFWTKVGTSTGVAESGTVEEIDRFVAQGNRISIEGAGDASAFCSRELRNIGLHGVWLMARRSGVGASGSGREKRWHVRAAA